MWEGVGFVCREEGGEGRKGERAARQREGEDERERYLVAGLGLEVQHTHTQSGWEALWRISAGRRIGGMASRKASSSAAAA